jgi:hypothetical protein
MYNYYIIYQQINFRMTQVISNVEYSILRALGTDADFLYDTVDSYIKDAQGSNNQT